MELSNPSRRRFLSPVAAGVPVMAAAAACGSGPTQTGAGGNGGNGGGSGSASYWFLTGQPQQGIRENAVKRWNKANPTKSIKYTEFQNDAYKTKIKTAVGANQAPTIIWGWGGGGLGSYVGAGKVVALDDFFSQHADLKSKLFPSAFGAATIGGKIYALPCEAVQPIVLYYNKKLFEKAGAEPPKSWDDFFDLIPKFQKIGVAPISLAGQSRWTNMMWLEFLFDRIGGPDVFNNVLKGEKGAWSDPAAIEGLTQIQKLVKAGGFIKGFSSVTADSNADQALLYTGKAAMLLQGSWVYGGLKADGGSLVSGGHLGYQAFPSYSGGKGDASNQYGNPGQYLSISAQASDTDKQIAMDFFANGVLTDDEVSEWIKTGSVPIVTTAESKLSSSPDADFLKFVYQTSSGAKVFSQSWDQALSPTAAETVLENIAKIFQLSITPQQFAGNLNATIGS